MHCCYYCFSTNLSIDNPDDNKIRCLDCGTGLAIPTMPGWCMDAARVYYKHDGDSVRVKMLAKYMFMASLGASTELLMKLRSRK